MPTKTDAIVQTIESVTDAVAILKSDPIRDAIEHLSAILRSTVNNAASNPLVVTLTASRDGMIAAAATLPDEYATGLRQSIAQLDKDIDAANNGASLVKRAELHATYGAMLRAIVEFLCPPAPVSLPVPTAKRGRPANGTGTPSVLKNGTPYVKSTIPARTPDGTITYAPSESIPCGSCAVCLQHASIGMPLANMRQNMTGAVESLASLDNAAGCIGSLNLAILTAYPQAVTVTGYAAPVATVAA